MRLILLSLVLMLVAACGKDGGGNSRQEQVSATDRMWDDSPYEVKDATVDVPATIDGSSITFKGSKTSTDSGDRIKCTVYANMGDVYQYSVKGNTLYLQRPQGNIELRKVNSFSGGGVFGVWSHVSKTEVGTFETIYSINPTHVVIMKKCEG